MGDGQTHAEYVEQKARKFPPIKRGTEALTDRVRVLEARVAELEAWASDPDPEPEVTDTAEPNPKG